MVRLAECFDMQKTNLTRFWLLHCAEYRGLIDLCEVAELEACHVGSWRGRDSVVWSCGSSQRGSCSSAVSRFALEPSHTLLYVVDICCQSRDILYCELGQEYRGWLCQNVCYAAEWAIAISAAVETTESSAAGSSPAAATAAADNLSRRLACCYATGKWTLPTLEFFLECCYVLLAEVYVCGRRVLIWSVSLLVLWNRACDVLICWSGSRYQLDMDDDGKLACQKLWHPMV